MILTIKDYLAQTQSKPFIGTMESETGVTGNDFQIALEGYIANNYYNYHFSTRFFKVDEIAGVSYFQSLVRTTCDNVYRANEYTYDKLYKTTLFDYNPISNYDMVEHEETENRGNDITRRDIGTHTDVETDDGRTITDTYGKDTMTGDTKDDKAPFNSQNFQNLDKGHSTQVRDARTDTHADGGTKLTKSYGGHLDTDTLQHGHDITRDLTRKGNIGTMTTQDMIAQEREIAMFNLVAIVANDIISALCVKYKGVAY